MVFRITTEKNVRHIFEIYVLFLLVLHTNAVLNPKCKSFALTLNKSC